MTDQPKIKAGDLVRIVGGAQTKHGLPIGSVHKVCGVLSNDKKLHYVYIFGKVGCLVLRPNEFELVAVGWGSSSSERPSKPEPEETTTLRDQFAMAALTGVIEVCKQDTPKLSRNREQMFARKSYQIADAMMQARKEGQGDE